MQNELLTCGELAIRLRLKPETVRRWVRQKRVPAIRLSPKVVRFDWEAVRRALASVSLRQGKR